jgi:pimeloyl-ACP methyl ester carboxylesterase
MSADSVISTEGVRLSYDQAGRGPGLVLVHGGMQTSRNFERLASTLSSSYRVVRYDRRGRRENANGGTDGAPDRLARETADLIAVTRATAASYVFGLSSGAILAMAAAKETSAIEKLVLYEPPLALGGVDPGDFGKEFLRALEQQRLGKAMALLVRCTGDRELLSNLPAPLLTLLFGLAVRSGAPAPNGERLRDLLLSMQADISIQRAAAAVLAPLSSLATPSLLVGGSRSNSKLTFALDRLERELPVTRRALIHGSGHLAAENDGKPEAVAQVIDSFLRSSVLAASK